MDELIKLIKTELDSMKEDEEFILSIPLQEKEEDSDVRENV